MRWSGLFVLLFLVYHVLDLTIGTLHPSSVAPFQAGQPYANVVGDFRIGFVALIYALAVGLLGLHLNHGIWSFFQTLGLTRSRGGRRLRAAATAVAVALTAGNVLIPLAVLAGVVR
jgi:succinate dehydrogenase / fumarate reductase cytochrome b subunit